MVVNSDADITLFTRLLHMEIVDAFFNICAIACNKALLCQAPTISALLLGATTASIAQYFLRKYEEKKE